jgi:hypothetical protein
LRRSAGAQPRDAAYAAWDEVLATATDVRIGVDDAESPRATAQRLVRDGDLDERAAAALATLTRAVEQASYARTVAADSSLADSAGTVHLGLMHSVSGRERLRARCLPPSVLAATARGTARLAGLALDQVDRGFGAAHRLLLGRRVGDSPR